MNAYAQAQAFNECYQVGDRLMVVDPYGSKFIDKLQRRAIVLDKAAYIHLEVYLGLVDIACVIKKVNSSEIVVIEGLLNLRKRFVERTRGQVKHFEASISQYTKMTGMLKQLLQQTRERPIDETRKEKLIADYESLLLAYELKLTKVATAYESAVTRLHQLTGQ